MNKNNGNAQLIESLKIGILAAVTFNNLNDVCKIAEIFVKGNLPILEIPLRTTVALNAISVIKKEFPDLTIGAGTILSKQNLIDAVNAGAEFGLAPGLNVQVVEKAKDLNFPFIPGVMTPSEIEQALEMDCKVVKIFPIEQLGGISYIKALNGPYGHTKMKYIPMGGISFSNFREYLKIDNVISVGGSWIAPTNLIQESDYLKIEKNINTSVAELDKNK